jgi:hypothetical protein
MFFHQLAIDAFGSSAINLGVILQFRSNLFDALSYVMTENLPFLHDFIEYSHQLYSANIYGMPDYLGIDRLANMAGQFNRVDTTLRFWMQGHCRKYGNNVTYSRMLRQSVYRSLSVYSISMCFFCSAATFGTGH